MQTIVPLADLDYGEEETNAVLDVLNKRWLTMGAVTQEFEDRFADFLGVNHAIAVANGTVALHMACLALDIGPGDEVIVPSLSFVATANAVLYTGAEVRFADIIGPDELNISPREIERLINSRTKAVIVMHYGGYPCRMSEIQEISRRHGIAIIEDSAHAPGAYLDGRAMGAWGEIGCFSFFSNKNLAVGEGGMLVTNRDSLAKKLRLLRSHGMTTLTWDRHQGHAHTYDVVDLGFNYRSDEIRSALGLVQLSKLVENNQRRAVISARYWQDLENLSLGLPFRQTSQLAHIDPAFHIFPIILPEHIEQSTCIQALRQRGVQTSIHYPPIHQFTYHSQLYPGVSLPLTEHAAARELTLPLFPSMRESHIQTVVNALRSVVGQEYKLRKNNSYN